MPARNRKSTVCSEEDLFASLSNTNERRTIKRKPQARYVEENNYQIEMMRRDSDCLGDLSPEKKENVRSIGFKKSKDGRRDLS